MSSALDLYVSAVSNRLNEIMKVLTIVATFFLPLTFVTGFFGQNFGWMVRERQPRARPSSCSDSGARRDHRRPVHVVHRAGYIDAPARPRAPAAAEDTPGP